MGTHHRAGALTCVSASAESGLHMLDDMRLLAKADVLRGRCHPTRVSTTKWAPMCVGSSTLNRIGAKAIRRDVRARHGCTTKPRRAACRRSAYFRGVVCALSGALRRVDRIQSWRQFARAGEYATQLKRALMKILLLSGRARMNSSGFGANAARPFIDGRHTSLIGSWEFILKRTATGLSPR